MCARYQSQSVKGSKPLTILWFRGSNKGRGNSQSRQEFRDRDMKRRRIDSDMDRYRSDSRYSGHSSHRFSSSRSRSTSLSRSPCVRNPYVSYSHRDHEHNDIPSHGGELIPYDARMDPMASHPQLESYCPCSLEEPDSHHPVIESMSSHFESMEPAPMSANEEAVCTSTLGLDKSVDLRMMLMGNMSSNWTDGSWEPIKNCPPTSGHDDRENHPFENFGPLPKKRAITFKIKNYIKSSQSGIPGFQCANTETAEEEQFEHVTQTMEESASRHSASENNREGFVPIQPYEEKDEYAELSPAHIDTPTDRAGDTSVSTQRFVNELELANIDISPAYNMTDRLSDMNQRLVCEKGNDTVGELPLQDALSAVFQKRAKLEQAFRNDCIFLAQSVEIFSRSCPNHSTLLLSILKSTLKTLSEQVTKEMEEFANSLLPKVAKQTQDIN